MTLPKPMNKIAVNIVMDAIHREKELGVQSVKIGSATVIDMGVKSRGSLEAGLIVAQICLRGLALTTIEPYTLDNVVVPAIAVSTGHPVETCMVSQLAG